MAGPTILLTRQDVAQGIDAAKAIDAIEHALAQYEKGNDYLPPKAIFEIPVEDAGAYAACIVGYPRAVDLLSMKVGQERSNNLAKNLPTTNSWVMVFDPQTGQLLMICDGTLPTMLRTAAAAAVGARHLAQKNAKTLAIIGAGQLGRQCAQLVATVRPFEKMLICDQFPDAAQKMAEELADKIKLPIEVVDAESACRQGDVLVTATNSRQPIIQAQWIRPGTHLSCMGSDLHEKIECEMALLSRCRIFADKIEHAIKRGEVSQAVQKGVLGEDCYLGSLGQVISGEVQGRTDDEQITMFDGVGIGIQDTTICRTIYDQAIAGNLGTRLAFS